MADLRGRGYSDKRVYVKDAPIFQVKGRDGKPQDRYWMNILIANDQFENEADFVDRPSLGWGRPYEDKDGQTQWDHSMAYSKSQLDKMAKGIGLADDYDVQDLRGQTFVADLMPSGSQKFKGLLVNTAHDIKPADPLDKAAHDANTRRAAELRDERAAERDAKKTEPQAQAQTKETAPSLDITDEDLPF